MLALARRKADELGLAASVELRQGDVRTLPYDDASFDVVTCQGVLHHLADMRPCLAEIARVLRPGGALYLAEPCHGTTRALLLFERVAARRQRHAEPAAPLDRAVPGHDEGPIDVAELTAILDDLRIEYRVDYWSLFPGLQRVRPLALQRALIRALCRPWRHRGGNMAVVTGRR
jgi:SAM-dependent methyltransferase